jgi:GNAT superfamily N-acetyltransferase
MVIRLATASELPRLEPLWRELYEHQRQHGMRLAVPEQGFQTWQETIEALLDRFAAVVVAEEEGAINGFASCRLRVLPPYFGGALVGSIGEVCVGAASRRGRVGRRLIEEALAWFRGQGVRRVELQVLADNPDARRFYRELGWREELVQMIWDDENGPA